MLQKWYRLMIQERTERIMIFAADNNEKKTNYVLENDIKLPSSHPFRLSQQIENNTSITHNITHQSSKQYLTQTYNQWPHSCIGLILCEHHQNNQTLYVYGTGTLIHNNIVLTSAQNVYCLRLNTQYKNIRFIVGVSGDKCSGIYNVNRVHYPKKYTTQAEYENYNFAVLQLHDDLSECCGYVGWKTINDRKEVEKYTQYSYFSDNQEGSFQLRLIAKNENLQQDQCCSGSGVLIKEGQNHYSIIGINNSAEREGFIQLCDKIRNYINYWIYFAAIYLYRENLDAQVCKYLSQANCTYLTTINLRQNNIGAQGCKYLSQANWVHLRVIYLGQNNISAQGCKYLSQANWPYLREFYLDGNHIDAQGCKYLSQVKRTNLKSIYLGNNKMNSQGCKYLSQANWTDLTYIDLHGNDIQGMIYKLLFLSSHPKTNIQI